MSDERQELPELPALNGPLARHLDDPIEHAELEAIRRRLHASRRLPRVRRVHPLGWVAAAAVMVFAGASAAWWTSQMDEPGPLRLATGAPLTSVRGAGGDIALSDGSTLTLSEGTEVDAVENAGDRVALVQGDGEVTYDIRPGGPRRWSIDAGALVVDVLGTELTVLREPSRVRVSVSRGRVRVRGDRIEGGLRTLEAGEAVEVGLAPRIVASDEPGEAADPVFDDASPTRVSPAETETAEADTAGRAPRPAPAEPRWRALARDGAWRDAFDSLGESGLRRETARAQSVDELFALADTARLSGHPDLAVDPLGRIMAEHHDGPRVALAALTLGRLQLDALDAPDDAVTSLERARALGWPTGLSEAGSARLIEAHRRAGHHERARSLAVEYLRDHPHGRSAREVRAVLSDAVIEVPGRDEARGD